MNTQPLPLFPLSAHLLPEGRMALRIFEPRYVRMVKEACAKNGEFVMCMLNAQGEKSTHQHIYPIGTVAKVIDFDLLEDGLLGIKVAGQYCVEVENIFAEPDGLRIGQCKRLPPWTCEISPQEISPMDERLQDIFACYDELAMLYENPRFDDAHWVLQRWLELLPIGAKQKQYFLEQQDCRKLFNYVSALVQ
ncbi:LON peptidase substrate-binding domain-containing protein [Alteromonas sp. C1M14]|uniref:LON peptidase substrate-binding domain-containing protein n=1 Tax=Alteromonas sp. C1M14 TaxID=2841567 RepID=UPI001C094697|nr:LON peptidase substrate-binding domain-containing protein [Alteromonas sp. C1M14]MBU2979050.1 LON peptidase substrate-binding domain-containing protein [Alteromonas sp. C1M14]